MPGKRDRIVKGGSLTEVLRIALPLILSSSCHAVNMFVDRLMLARHSQEAVAAAFTSGLTNFTIMCLFVGTIGYTGTFVAQYEGARQRDRIGGAVWQGIYLSLLGGALMLTGLWWAEALFGHVGHDPAVMRQEVVYFRILCFGAFFFLACGAFSSFWTGRGRTVLVLIVSIVTTLFNLPLNYLLIFGKCGLPELGVAGAAWGTLGSELLGMLIYLVLFLLPSARRHFGTLHFRFDPKLMLRMIRFGLPSGIHLTLDLISFNIFSMLLGGYGVAVHEASSITFGINNIAFCPVLGIGMTASVLVGQAIGGGNIPLARKSVRSCLILVEGYTLLMVLLFTCGQQIVLAPFVRPGDTGQAEALRYAGIMLYLISAYLFFDGLNITFSNAIRGAGDTRFPMWVMTLSSIFVFALPCVILFSLGMPWWTLWLTLLVDVPLLATVFTLRYLGGKWTHMRVIDTPPADPADPAEA